MNIDVQQQWRIQVISEQSRLFKSLATTGLDRRLPRVDVSTGLEPQTQSLMTVQYDSASRDNKGRGRQVVIIFSLIEEVSGLAKSRQSAFNRLGLSLVDGIKLRYHCAQRLSHE